MKKILKKLSFAALLFGAAISQSTAQVVTNGSSHINIGYEFPDYMNAFVSSLIPLSTVGPFYASYQYAFWDKIATGIQLGYLQGKTAIVLFTDPATGQEYSYSATYGGLTVMAKADYHYLKHNKLDVYSGLSAGLGFGTAKVMDHGKETNSGSADLFVLNLRLAGVRFMVTDYIGAYAEAGLFSTIATNDPSFSAGLSAKFGGARKPAKSRATPHAH